MIGGAGAVCTSVEVIATLDLIVMSNNTAQVHELWAANGTKAGSKNDSVCKVQKFEV